MPPQKARKRTSDRRNACWAGCSRTVLAGGVGCTAAVMGDNLLGDVVQGSHRAANDLLDDMQDDRGAAFPRHLLLFDREEVLQLGLGVEDAQGSGVVPGPHRMGVQLAALQDVAVQEMV